MSWEPSVRTRHLTVIIFLILVTASALLCFNLARLLNAHAAAKREKFGLLEIPIYNAAQQAIFNRPLENPVSAISFDANVRSLIKAGENDPKGFAYVALISLDGAVIAQSDPQNLLQTAGQPYSKIKSMGQFESARWYRQLWDLWRNDNVYEIQKTFNFRNAPFARLVAGVPATHFREDMSPTIKLSVIFASIIAGLCLLTAVMSSNLVLWPLREVMDSIEELEVESAKISEPRPVNVEMQSIAQRLRELGRRFAGNRTEIEAIRDQLQQVVGSLSERVLLLDRDRRVIMASPEAEKMLSGGRFTLRGQRLAEALSYNHPITALTERAYHAGQSLQEVATFPVNGSGQQQAVVASLQIFEDRGQPAGALLTLRDFETLQRLETQLDFATKLAALNRITAGVAHEVKNPLHAMVLHLELLSAKLEAGLDPKPHVDILMSEVNRLKRVVQTFLDFTRPVELKLHQVDANVLTREVILLAADARAQGVNMEEHYGGGPLVIKADSDLLKQAILNIIINGCQVMPQGGKLMVETGRDEENRVFIAITDSGPGIPEEARDKIFNLYYTTKPKGSGIGLAQAFRAVQLHNGRIKVESEVGAGTCFRIILPAA
ncbi:MAG: Adaptive-response sensory-kinase SasA [Acidobacteria bacterium]|nr:Adaptive-response sensory-kinase SasA [Acidobacteriota bacterium]